MAKKSRKRASNKAYLRDIMGRFSSLPKRIAAETAARIYEYAVASTAIDSGQAVLNWKISAHTGTPHFESPDLMWGYGNVAPVPPAGMKGDKGANAVALRTFLVEQRLVQAAYLETLKFSKITVYNPIEPGAFANFAPGDDSRYAATAFRTWNDVKDTLTTYAKMQAEKFVASQVPGAKAV